MPEKKTLAEGLSERVNTVRSGDVAGSAASDGEETGEVGRYYTRMQYQERQFLRAADFQDEQAYHIAKLREHNRTLHTYGVCEGLVVGKSRYIRCVEVSAGSANDRLGNPILLTEAETLDLGSACIGDKAYLQDLLLYMSFGAVNASDPAYNVNEGGFAGCTRTVEKPVFTVCPADRPSLDVRQLLLATVRRDAATGEILSCDSAPLGRLSAGVKMSMDSVPDQSIESRMLADGAVVAGKIKDGSITAAKLAGGAVTREKIAGMAVGTAELAEEAVTAAKLKKNSITSMQLANAAVNSGALQSAAVTTDKLADGAVTSAKVKHSRSDWSEATINANSRMKYMHTLRTEEEFLQPMAHVVYPLEMGIEACNCKGTEANKIYWYEITERSGGGAVNRMTCVENTCDRAVKVRVLKFFWK
ncbi:MAG: hypothetical protein GXX99_03460 [Clostridiales bacterium]|nr:hypothetical protein [Clostridiales bacterium]